MADQQIFATLKAERRIWAIASIHGEAARLHQLHGQLAERLDASDIVVYLGNFLGRGPAVAETVDELLLFRRTLLGWAGTDPADIVYLRGSQEEMWQKLLQIQFAPNAHEVLEWMMEHGLGPTLEAYGGSIAKGFEAAAEGAVMLSQWTGGLRDAIRQFDGHNSLMSVLRRAAYSAAGTLLFVNTGVDVTRPLSEQTDAFWWGGNDFDYIESAYGGFRRVVRGFDPRHRGVIVKDATVSLDGGCGMGGPLVAGCFDPAGELVDLIEA